MENNLNESMFGLLFQTRERMADSRLTQPFKSLSWWMTVWRKMEDDIFLSVHAGIPHTRDALKARDKVLSLGTAARKLSFAPTPIEELEAAFNKYREALDEAVGIDLAERGVLKRLLSRIYRFITETEECYNVV